MLGFGRKEQKYRLKKLWFSFYSKENEDEPISVVRQEIYFLAGQDFTKPALRLAEAFIYGDSTIYEVLIHQGQDPVPASGEAVVARVCREPFRNSSPLPAAK